MLNLFKNKHGFWLTPFKLTLKGFFLRFRLFFQGGAMQKLFFTTKELDLNAVKTFKIPSEILMENAACGIFAFLQKKFKKPLKKGKKPTLLLLVGSGDNGADVLALARMASEAFNIFIFLCSESKSALNKAQLERIKAINEAHKDKIKFIKSLEKVESLKISCVIDGIFGAGFKGELDSSTKHILQEINKMECLKIACDISSGIAKNGEITSIAFKADFTLSMGALKCALFLDSTADFVGKVKLISLGIPTNIFNSLESKINLLQISDLKLPLRLKKATNKGDFGHLSVLIGEKSGAGILSALSALSAGAGLVSIVSDKFIENLPFSIMQTKEIPQNTSAIALGMGLGAKSTLPTIPLKIPLVLDADIFYHNKFLEFLTHDFIVLTPHPKEFTQILKVTNLANITTQELQKDRIRYVLEFSKAYPKAVLVLKGAFSIIAKNENIYINPFANNALSKGGSGDVLAGIIASYLAQRYTPLDSAINGVLTHSLCAKRFVKKHNNFSLTPLDLIKELRYI